ncbi:hypothetical protein TNCT_399391 [Trichonephila clavata]|uniref:Uncharacterized protein n=1 Tax=Trichonephila clavata TaxID=2740835 RepID=A0A8X6IBZ6_TRICU|nr:hypothetical protein TNCT_399391 [Trichonephila clavata]
MLLKKVVGVVFYKQYHSKYNSKELKRVYVHCSISQAIAGCMGTGGQQTCVIKNTRYLSSPDWCARGRPNLLPSRGKNGGIGPQNRLRFPLAASFAKRPPQPFRDAIAEDNFAKLFYRSEIFFSPSLLL